MVAGKLTVIITSSEELAQTPLVIVQRKVEEAPIVNPVTPDVDDAGVVTVALPATTVHKSMPEAGALPARVAVVTLHKI